MKLLEIYKYTAMFLTFFVGLCIFAYIGLIPKILIASAAAIITVILIVLRNIKKFVEFKSLNTAFILISAAVFFSALFSIFSLDIYAESFKEHSSKHDCVKLKIVECDYSLSYTSRYTAVVLESDLLPYGTNIFVNSPIGYLDSGTLLEGEVVYSSLDDMSSRTFDAEKYYLAQRIMLSAEDKSLTVTGYKFSIGLKSFFSSINNRLSAMLSAHLNPDAAGLTSAVLLGNRDGLSDITKRDFRRIGISHLLVVSGTHFSIMMSFITAAMQQTKLKRTVRSLLSIGFIILVMGITGFTPSVMRAGIMHILSQLSVIATRRANMINSFALSGTLIVLLNPFSVLDIGLQLSFAATYGCIIFIRFKADIYRRIRKRLGIPLSKNRIIRFVMRSLETVMMTLVVTLCTLPLSWLYFGEISLISVPVNVVFIPIITLLMYLTVIYLILYPLRLFIVPSACILDCFCSLILKLAGVLSAGDNIMFAVNYDFTPFFFIPLTAILIVVFFLPRKWKVFSALSAGVLCISFFLTAAVFSSLDRDNVHITYFTENKNDGFVVKSQGKALLCDFSDGSFSFTRNLTEEIGEMNICEIETVLFTHYHNKHVQLLGKLCENEIVRSVVLPVPTDEREENIFHALSDTAEYYGISCLTLGTDELLLFGDAEITLFEREYLARSTHPVTAAKITAFGDECVFMSCSFNQGDPLITVAAEQADYLFFGNHSPVYKNTFGLSFEEKPKAMIVSSQAYEYMDDDLRLYSENCVSYIDAEIYRITSSRNEKPSTPRQ